MLRKLQLFIFLLLCLSTGLLAQEVILSDEFDAGDGKWNGGWIDNASATVTVSIDNTGKLSGANSYKLAIVKGSADTYRIQRNAALALLKGSQYTVSFMAVADRNASINVLFELSGDPYSKAMNETANVTTTAKTFTYSVVINEDIPTNMLKFHFGGPQNDSSTIWIDNIVVTKSADPSIVAEWGQTPARGKGWPILNRDTTPGGEAAMGADAPPPAWATISGRFAPLTIAAGETFVASGTLEYVGGGVGGSYVGLRYALAFQDSATLLYKNTDSAQWSSTKNYYGYQFTPRAATSDIANGTNGRGMVWTLKNVGGWNSTYNADIRPITIVEQQPPFADITEGVYDWAYSVTALENGDNEVKWYMVKQHGETEQAAYWFAGSVIDTMGVTNTFNCLNFGVGNGITTTLKQFKLANVKAIKGSPIAVPDAPFTAFYISDWGQTPARGNGWPTLNDTTYLVGDAAMGNGAPPAAWATIKGGFSNPVQATTSKAVIFKGQLEYVGGGVGGSYVGLRYALTYQDSATLANKNTDSAKWVSTKNYYGYQFTPRAATSDIANGTNGRGMVWTLNNVAGWNSTYNADIRPITVVEQKPNFADITEGVYDWAISVQPLANGDNEVRWYLVKKHAATEQAAYWFAGTVIDTMGVTTKFNGVQFGVGNGITTTLKQFNLYAVKVDRGDPIVVPDAPFNSFYVANWGKTPARGAGWPILNDTTYLVGDAAMGNGAPPAAWATIAGGFDDAVTASVDKAVIVKGQLEYVGGGVGGSYVGLRYALAFLDSATLNYKNTDSAQWAYTKGFYGYQFTPRAATSDIANGTNGRGMVWTLKNVGGWNSTYNADIRPITVVEQKPPFADITEGVYDWAMSVQPLANGLNEVRWYLVKKHTATEQAAYWFGGKVIDSLAVTNKFNMVLFGVGNGITTTLKQFNLYAVQVDRGKAIEIPKAPWQNFYVGSWGFNGGTGGWNVVADPDSIIGNISVEGTAAATGLVALRGGFGANGPVVPESDSTKALVISGDLEFVGGGFDAANSFRFGISYSDSAKTLVDSAWTGTDSYSSGYLFIPMVGTNALPKWGSARTASSFGAIVNGKWSDFVNPANYALAGSQSFKGATAGAGTYTFKMSVFAKAANKYDVRYTLQKKDKSYFAGGWSIDSHNPLAATQFNAIGFALNTNAGTTGLKLSNVYVEQNKALDLTLITDVESVNSALPKEYALSQNYPNPFNPTTTIKFAMPKDGNVSLIVYDILGRNIATLVNSEMKAGFHQVTFNASNLASGVYFYQIKSGDFTSVKKLMLMK